MTVTLTSAGMPLFFKLLTPSNSKGPLIALLHEKEPIVVSYALEKLNLLVNVFWAEISDAVGRMYVSSPLSLPP